MLIFCPLQISSFFSCHVLIYLLGVLMATQTLIICSIVVLYNYYYYMASSLIFGRLFTQFGFFNKCWQCAKNQQTNTNPNGNYVMCHCNAQAVTGSVWFGWITQVEVIYILKHFKMTNYIHFHPNIKKNQLDYISTNANHVAKYATKYLSADFFPSFSELTLKKCTSLNQWLVITDYVCMFTNCCFI